ARLAPPAALLLLVPRHPQRFDEVAALASARGLALQRRSADDAVRADTRVLLGDSMGEMFAYYAAADVALIGGSWLAFGGQNLIEACAVGTAVVIGPHTFNFQAVAEDAERAGAAVRAQDAEAGMREALALVADPERRAQIAAAGRAFATTHQGATARSVALLTALAARREA
ncbi:MAG: glycosyltransferase, partial [Proteobacteria bacterium]|nr:glycosyltransferase [Pseudomonadota bacterium]